MRNNLSIIPAILATSEEEYKTKIEKISLSEVLEGGWVQIDFMDNKFVQNRSVGTDVVLKYPTSLKKEAHLMVDYPDSWMDDLTGAKFERIIFPVEDMAGIEERINTLKNLGVEVGLALNPETEVAKIAPFVAKIDVALILAVHPGFSGQEFIPGTLKKIKEALRLRSGGNNFLIEVDGGINKNNVREVVEAGADNIVIGTNLINGDIQENFAEIWEQIKAS